MNRDSSNEHSNPGRDRALAAKVRHGWRDPLDMGRMSEDFLSSQAMRTARRFLKIREVLRDQLDERRAAAIHPHSLRKGRLVLLVEDTILLAELRNHYHRPLLEACIDVGAGVTDIAYRVGRPR